jgi:cysteine desulfurase/selenocysteine lyase
VTPYLESWVDSHCVPWHNAPMLDPSLSAQFPILQKKLHNQVPLIYFDNAATTQKPLVVIDAIVEYYSNFNANIHRGVHVLAEESTDIWENSRQAVADFFGSAPEELVVTRNTTEALNILVQGWGEENIQSGDVILVSLSEHHSNFVPWQQLAKRKGATFLTLPLQENGQVDISQATELFQKHRNHLKVVALHHISNTLGTVVPIDRIITTLRELKIRDQVLLAVDIAQSAAHLPIKFKQWGVDAMAFSGHKMYAPMGIGGLIVRKELLSTFTPVLLGGGMISQVLPEETEYAEELADRFTAGTPDVASLYGLAKACDFIQSIGWAEIQHHEEELTRYALEKLQQLPEITIVGPTTTRNDQDELIRLGSVAFLYEGVHSHDVAQVLDRYGVAVRSGQHCTMPLHMSRGWMATTRASFALYNTTDEIDVLVQALHEVKTVFRRGKV